MKQGVVHPEVGIWSLGRPAFAKQVYQSQDFSQTPKDVICMFEEIDVWADNLRQQ